MVARSKLYMQLELLEDEIREKLVSQLQLALNGEDDSVFCVEKINKHKSWKGRCNKRSEYLVDLGAKILTLRDKLGESSENTIAEQVCVYCRLWNDNVNTDSKYAQIIAKQFLDAIKTEKYK